MSDDATALPKIGTEVMMPVVNSPTRTTIFAEAAVVASPSPLAIELIFLRNELVVPAQAATVTGHENGAARMTPGAAQVTAQLTDIGHARMDVGTAVELGALLLRHARDNHSVDISGVVRGLTPPKGKAK